MGQIFGYTEKEAMRARWKMIKKFMREDPRKFQNLCSDTIDLVLNDEDLNLEKLELVERVMKIIEEAKCPQEYMA